MRITRWTSERLLDAIHKHEREAAYSLRERVTLDGSRAIRASCLSEAMAHATAAGRLEKVLCELSLARWARSAA